MYLNILLVTLFSYLPSTSAVAIPVECTNYPGYPVGTYESQTPIKNRP
jgi:hypothetical protein